MSQPQAKTSGKRQRAHSIGASDKRLKSTAGVANIQPLSIQHQQQSADGDHALLIDQAIDAVIAAGISSPSSSDPADVGALRQEVGALKETVQRHEQTIAVLEHRINDLLSAFGLPSASTIAMSSALDSASATAASSTGSAVTANNPSQQQQLLPDGASSQSSSDQPWSVVDRHRRLSPKTIQESIIAAVYVDKAASDRRAVSFIVTGLPPSSSSTDTDIVTHLCETEIGVRPVVTATKRLGRPSADRIQPLLVHTNNAGDAQQITRQAKRLRQSNNILVRNSVFINCNLTKAEALAGYEIRCRRRHALATKSSAAPLVTGHVSNAVHPPPVVAAFHPTTLSVQSTHFAASSN